MRFAVVGCGYIAPRYLETLGDHPGLELVGVTDRRPERAGALAGRHRTKVFASTEELLADPSVALVVNLTDPENHHEVTRAALLAGKHVYSEKPLATDLTAAKDLVALAETRGLRLSSAPCTVLSDTARTLQAAVAGGAVGRVRLVYAELDDNPVHLMAPEGWTNDLGTPWPYLNEYRVGCTLEHAGYYLTWLATLFGPARSVTAFSSCLVPEKMVGAAAGADTPDFAVACITFASGVVARLTCSIVAPYDHSIRIVGDKGILTAEECWHHQAPVRLERFTQLGLNARKARIVRTSPVLQRLTGVGGRRVRPPSGRRFPRGRLWADIRSGRRSLLRSVVREVSRRQLIAIDFLAGVADLAAAIDEGRPERLPAPFVLHVNELALAIQEARSHRGVYELTTTFDPLPTAEDDPVIDLRDSRRPASLADAVIAGLHRH